MARWHYPPWKRSALQAVLCLILACSIALAEWVVKDHQGAAVGGMELPQSFGTIGIRIPGGWELQEQSQVPVFIRAVEPKVPGRESRVLTVKAIKVPAEMTPEQMLVQRMRLVPGGDDSVPIKIGGMDGILVSYQRRSDTEMYPQSGPVQKFLVAGCVTPEGLGVGIWLGCPNEQKNDAQANVDLIRSVAAGIVLPNEPE